MTMEHSYTELELKRLTKQGKSKRWMVTLVLDGGTLHSTKWYTSTKEAKEQARAYLREMVYSPLTDITAFLSNQTDFNEEITL